MQEPITRVVIVGGGMAGWLSAVHIQSGLDATTQVTLIESSTVPTVGVGEGTTTSFRGHLRTLRIEEDDFLRGCGASFKNGIRFVGWNGQAGPDSYLHPFFSGTSGEHENPLWAPHAWLRLYHEGVPNLPSMPLACWAESWLIEQRRAPITFRQGKPTPQPLVSYAYHLDAARTGSFLRDIAVQRRVRHIIDDVQGVVRDEQGDLTAVRTKNSGDIEADLFIDCTGFRGVLIRELEDEFVDFGSSLLNDAAITARIPFPEGLPHDIEASTQSIAMKYGWMWQIPLFDRLGAGYVYSSQFVDDDAAEIEFRNAMRLPEDIETKRIRFRSGCLQRSWVRNCVAIGLSSGFVEPLEATGIAMISHAIFRLLESWPHKSINPTLRERFNMNLFHSYEWIRDFLVMHYCFSQRDDSPYWHAVRQAETIPDSLRQRMQVLDERWPFGAMNEPRFGYHVLQSSLFCVLAGFNRYPRSSNAYARAVSPEQTKAILDQSSQRIRAIVGSCMDHAEYLKWVHGLQSSSTAVQASA